MWGRFFGLEGLDRERGPRLLHVVTGEVTGEERFSSDKREHERKRRHERWMQSCWGFLSLALW